MIVDISDNELQVICLVASMRQVANLSKGRQQKYGAVGEGFARHVRGCAGEFVAAKYFDVFWTGMITLGARDVGDWEIRTAPINGKLIVHKQDDDDARFVLVRETARWDQYVLEGWIRGADAKDETWWSDPSHGNRPAYFVPAENLQPIPRP